MWVVALLACQPEPASVVRMAPAAPGVTVPLTVDDPSTPTPPTGTGTGTGSGGTATGGTTGTGTATGGTTTPGTTGPTGFIGSPCDSDADCPYDGGACLPDPDFPRGTCSAPCDETCPDQAGHPVTACIDDPVLDAPGCLSRCDFGVYPYEGCRPGYGCVRTARPPGLDDVFACMPYAERDIGACREGLAASGVPFEPAIRSDEHPSDHPELTCHLDHPVRLGPTVAGVDLRYWYADDPARVLVDCDTANSLVATAEDVAAYDVVEITHLGTYVCRTIGGTDTLSQHGLGRAVDIGGFVFADGSIATVVDHWEHGTSSPGTWEGAFLYDAVHRWFDLTYWNILLTPEYNAAHDDHFHVDLSDGGGGLFAVLQQYLGPPTALHGD